MAFPSPLPAGRTPAGATVNSQGCQPLGNGACGATARGLTLATNNNANGNPAYQARRDRSVQRRAVTGSRPVDRVPEGSPASATCARVDLARCSRLRDKPLAPIRTLASLGDLQGKVGPHLTHDDPSVPTLTYLPETPRVCGGVDGSVIRITVLSRDRFAPEDLGANFEMRAQRCRHAIAEHEARMTQRHTLHSLHGPNAGEPLQCGRPSYPHHHPTFSG